MEFAKTTIGVINLLINKEVYQEKKVLLVTDIVNDVYNHGFLTEEEKADALKHAPLFENKGLEEIKEVSKGIDKLYELVVLKRIEFFFVGTQLGISYKDPIEVFLENISRLSGSGANKVMTVIIENMRISKALTEEEAKDVFVWSNNVCNGEYPASNDSVKKFLKLINGGYVWLLPYKEQTKIFFKGKEGFDTFLNRLKDVGVENNSYEHEHSGEW